MAAPLKWLGLVAAFLLGAVVFTWPLAGDLGGRIWGDRFDAWTTMWLIWHLGDSLPGELSATTDRIFFPVGYNLWSFGHAALQLLGVPLYWAGVSVTATYNLLLLGALVGSAAAAWALGRRLGGDAGGWVAAAVFVFNPYLYGELSAGCIELVAAWFLPLQVLVLLRLCDEPGWRRAWPVVLVLGLTGPFNWYYTVFSGMLTLGVLVWRGLAGGRERWKAVGWMGAAVAVAAATNLPLLPHVRRETPARAVIEQGSFSAEAWEASYAITNGLTPLAELDEAALTAHDTMQVVVNSTALSSLLPASFVVNPLESTPGALAWTLGLFGLAVGGRRARGWMLLAGGFTVLTLGPHLLVDATPPVPDWSAERPLPYHWLYNHVPFFSKAYRPYRLGVVVLTCLAASAAVGAGRVRWGGWLAAAAWLFGASWPHWAGASSRGTASASVPEAYAALGELPTGGVIELPLQYQPLTDFNARFQYFQTVHGQPLLNCNQLIRRTDLVAFRDYVAGNRLLGVLLDLSRSEPPWAFGAEDVSALREDGFRYLVAHRQVPAPAAHLAGLHSDADRLKQPAWELLDGLGSVVVDDGEVVVYELGAGAGGRREDDWRDVELPFTRLGLPVFLTADQGLPLGEVEGGEVSLWIEHVAGEGHAWLVSGDVREELLLREGFWVHLSASLGAGALSLEADGELTVRVDGVQVREAEELAWRR